MPAGFVVKLTGRSVNGNLHIGTRLQAALFHGSHQKFKHGLRVLKVRRKSALIAHAGTVAIFL